MKLLNSNRLCNGTTIITAFLVSIAIPSQAITLIFEETGTGNPNVLGSPNPGFWNTSGDVQFGIPFNFVFQPGEPLDETFLDISPTNTNSNLGIILHHGNDLKGGTLTGDFTFTPTYEVVSPGFKTARIAVSSNYGSGFWGRIKALFKWRRARAWVQQQDRETVVGVTVTDYKDVALNPGEFGGITEPVRFDPNPNGFSVDSNDIVFLEVLLRDNQDITQLSLTVTDENLAPVFEKGNGFHHLPYLYAYDDATPSDFGIDDTEARFLSLNFTNMPENEITIGYREEFSDTVPEPTSIFSLLALGTLGAASTLKRKLKSSKSTEK